MNNQIFEEEEDFRVWWKIRDIWTLTQNIKKETKSMEKINKHGSYPNSKKKKKKEIKILRGNDFWQKPPY